MGAETLMAHLESTDADGRHDTERSGRVAVHGRDDDYPELSEIDIRATAVAELCRPPGAGRTARTLSAHEG
ncbi:MAG: hypothetical protein GDA49_09935 [Rhodospirillales bacterium]|nr:hypothetical protein [Rhodospirillales bacterium]